MFYLITGSILYIVIHVLINWQLLSVFWCYLLTSCYVSNDRRFKFNYFKMQVVFMSCNFRILISNWPWTQKFNRVLHVGKAIAFDFSHHSHELVMLYVQFLCSDWSNLTGQFTRKIYAASWNLLTDSWSCQSIVSSCDVFNCLFLLDVQNEIQLLSRFFCGWFVSCAFGWEMHCLSKSLEIRFWMASFSKLSLLAVAWGVRGLKSLKRFWPYLMAFRSSISTGKPEQLLSLMCFFFPVS